MSKDQEWPLVALPKKYEFENFMLAMSMPVMWLAFTQWLINTWRAQYAYHMRRRKPGAFIPKPPVKLSVYNMLQGVSCAEIIDLVRQYGISAQEMGLQWDLMPGGYGLGLHMDLYVPREQADFADCILYQNQGSYVVESPARRLRGYQIGPPWGVPARPRSFDQAITYFITRWIGQGWHATSSPIKAPKKAKPNKRPRLGTNGHKGKNIPER